MRELDSDLSPRFWGIDLKITEKQAKFNKPESVSRLFGLIFKFHLNRIRINLINL
jgi:hypothetical protein